MSVNVREDLLTPAEAAAYLRIHRSTFLRWVDSAGMPVIKISRKSIRIRRGDLDAWVSARQGQRQEEAEPSWAEREDEKLRPVS